ncbi:hypothetical protein [Candidatus Nesciobacter abundans]|uniref:diaminopimelate epimerase n=1 Tax=Candidatus Nesciobacter abundans TaxID=2601668 RepID=A0A5C0UGA0_9PROT|nr:hypothetical protein [Candidatus Nesciobacter abundans]QEK38839.1 hypothetical protein FZC36_00045 [Candidatus Nesciobacter abundans]
MCRENEDKKLQNKSRFIKAHGLGNDFVIFFSGIGKEMFSGREHCFAMFAQENIIHIADRKLGIGCDQVIYAESIHERSIGNKHGNNISELCNPQTNYIVKFWNSDGSHAAFCGNGIRAVALYIFDNILSNNLICKDNKTYNTNKLVNNDISNANLELSLYTDSGLVKAIYTGGEITYSMPCEFFAEEISEIDNSKQKNPCIPQNKNIALKKKINTKDTSKSEFFNTCEIGLEEISALDAFHVFTVNTGNNHIVVINNREAKWDHDINIFKHLTSMFNIIWIWPNDKSVDKKQKTKNKETSTTESNIITKDNKLDINSDNWNIMPYERGVGPTMACGSGTAAAAFVLWTLQNPVQLTEKASDLKCKVERNTNTECSRTNTKDEYKKLIFHTKLGKIEMSRDSNKIWQKGPAEISFEGEIII